MSYLSPYFTDYALPQQARDRLNTMQRDVYTLQSQVDALGGGEGGDPQGAIGLGWADYADSTYTEGSPFSIAAATPTLLPNDGVNGVKTYEPEGFTMYTPGPPGKINGIEGTMLSITLNCVVEPTNVGTTYVEFWFDIGGSIGELYRRIVSFPKGNGAARPITLTTTVYTLDTWEANGADVYVEANNTADIYDIRYVLGVVYSPPVA